MHVAQPDLAVLDARVAVAQVGVTGAERLDLGTAQRDASLKTSFDLIVEAGLAVLGELELACWLGGRHVGLSGGHGEEIRWLKTKSGGISAAALLCRVTKDPVS